MKTPKRFIAGAVCPSCKEMDKLMMWSENNVPHRECMACGFMDTLDEQGLSIPAEPSTRIAQPTPIAQESKPIRFFPNPKLNKTSH
ncbi:YheV family putative metal-binding protein [Entomomonas sp. E2T0]|uniref:YheV family putative zinc ribbon protein n=1 Tax=Entomomonas sp. E2T0 TaxID=2930213 RepID=UPI0022281CA0|nr:YheV family putative zinc ribbon protein [Entomomonas sp. E2T0]UYZ84770.1 YheV family putative metal-binding protein [Entomomonas sp. E2T0]